MWYRNAGSKVYHKAAEDYVRTGKGICGADIGRPYVFTESPVDGQPKLLADYPRKWGTVSRCKHCVRKEN